MKPMRFSVLVVLTFFFSLSFLQSQEELKTHWNLTDYIPYSDVSVSVHRGAGDLAPENALPSLEFTWGLEGCRGIPEVDIRTTKDGHLVMFHDGNFKRILPNASDEMKSKRIEDLTWEEVQKLDIGAFRGEQFKGQKVVSLPEICDALRKDPHRKILIDVKNVDLKRLADETSGLHSQIILAAGKYETIADWKRIAPDAEGLFWMGLGAGEDKIAPIIEQLKKDQFFGVDRMQIHVHFNEDGTTRPSREFLQETADYVHTHYPDIEFQLMPWDIHGKETTEHYKRLADLGAAGFGTDRPDICYQSLKEYYENKGKTSK